MCIYSLITLISISNITVLYKWQISELSWQRCMRERILRYPLFLQVFPWSDPRQHQYLRGTDGPCRHDHFLVGHYNMLTVVLYERYSHSFLVFYQNLHGNYNHAEQKMLLSLNTCTRTPAMGAMKFKTYVHPVFTVVIYSFFLIHLPRSTEEDFWRIKSYSTTGYDK